MTASTNNSAAGSTIVDGFEFARKALEIHATIDDSRLVRLHDSLARSGAIISYHLIGNINPEGQPTLKLRIQGNLLLNCQRCLEPFEFKLNTSSSFLLVADESAIPESADESDEDYLIADSHMRLLDLIEDEILLALPLAPKHQLEDCKASEKLDALKKPSPFAILQGLKTGKSQN